MHVHVSSISSVHINRFPCVVLYIAIYTISLHNHSLLDSMHAKLQLSSVVVCSVFKCGVWYVVDWLVVY